MQGPDLSWIDQIVGEDGLEVSDEVVRAIIEKPRPWSLAWSEPAKCFECSQVFDKAPNGANASRSRLNWQSTLAKNALPLPPDFAAEWADLS